MKKKAYKLHSKVIVINKRPFYEFFIKEELEAGLVLQGWEVQSLRAGKVNISNSYVVFQSGRAFLFGAHIIPLLVANAYQAYDSSRIRNLLLHQYEVDSLYGSVKRDGYTVVALSLYWKDAWCKVKLGVAKGKKQYEKRFSLKKREWQRNKDLFMKKQSSRYAQEHSENYVLKYK